MPNSKRVANAHLISTLGERFSFITLIFESKRLIGSDWGAVLILLAYTGTFVLAAPLATYVSDAFDRKRVLIASDLLRGILVLFYIPATWNSNGGLLISLVFLVLIVTAVGRATLWASTRQIVSEQHLKALNARLTANNDVGLALGTALGGFLYSLIPVDLVYVFDGLTYFASATIFLFVAFQSNDLKTNFSLRGWFTGNFQSLQLPRVWQALFALAITGLLVGMANTHILTYPPTTQLPASQAATLAFFAYSLGSISIAWIIAKTNIQAVLNMSFYLYGPLVAGLYFSPNIFAYSALAFGCGATAGYVSTQLNTQAMIDTPSELLATVAASLNLLLRLGMAIGLLIIPEILKYPPGFIALLVVLSILLLRSRRA